MKTPRPVAAGLFAFSALLLSGCSPEAAVPSAPPAAEGEALFASDEEALAAAEAAWEEYLELSFQVYAEGGSNPERLESVATGSILEADIARANDFAARGLRQTGDPVVLETSLQSYNGGAAGAAEVVMYACLDSFSVSAVDSTGTPIGDPNRQPTVTVQNTFLSDEQGELLLSDSEIWEDGAECAL